jgi:hypothetical protein
MKCLFEHRWGWPRRRGNRDMQVCLNCGCERESKVRFDGPRYHRTQEAIPNFTTPVGAIDIASRRPGLAVISSAAA